MNLAEREVTAGVLPPHVTLLYVRAAGAADGDLDARVSEVVERYQPRVELHALDPDEVEALTGERPRFPRLLLLRNGEVVGQAMGSCLPSRELDRVVRCAIDWV